MLDLTKVRARIRVIFKYLKIIFYKTAGFVKALMDNSPIHGLKHISNTALHPFERITWFCIVVAAITGTAITSQTQYKRYLASPTVVSLERDYRAWNGTLPAATLCYHDHMDSYKADQFIQDKWNIGIIDDEYFYFLEFLYSVINSTANNYGDLVRFAQDERFADIDLFEVAKSIDRSFEQSIASFNPNVHVDVQSVMTERGMCYAFNSPMSAILRDRKVKITDFKKPLSCQYEKQQCFLKLDIYESTGTIEIHSPYEVSVTDSEILSLQKSDEVLASYKIMETVASETLRDLSPTQRKCVFSDENTSDLTVYSKTLCLMKCRAIMALEMCNCVPYFYPFVNGPSCSPAGFECLQDFKWPIWALHICKCPSTCTEHKYSVHSIKKRTWSISADIPFHPKSSFRWDIIPPKIRIRRDVLFSFEDLMVSFGGAAALFLGFSFWAIFEVILVILKFIPVEPILKRLGSICKRKRITAKTPNK